MATYSNSSNSSSGYSHQQSSSTPNAIQTPQSEWGLQLSQLLSKLGQYQYNWALNQFNNGMGITDQNINNYMALAGQGAGLAQNLLGRYENEFEPIMDKYIQQAGSYNSEDRQRFMMGQAESTAAQADKAAIDSAQKELQSYGINPNSGRYNDLLLTSRLQDAATRAGAGTAMSQQVAATGRQMTQAAAQMGQNVPGMTVNALQSAFTGVSGAQNAELGMLNTGANLTNTAANFGNAAANANRLPPVGNQAQSTGNSANRSSGMSNSNSPQQQQPSRNNSSGNQGNQGSYRGNQGQSTYQGANANPPAPATKTVGQGFGNPGPEITNVDQGNNGPGVINPTSPGGYSDMSDWQNQYNELGPSPDNGQQPYSDMSQWNQQYNELGPSQTSGPDYTGQIDQNWGDLGGGQYAQQMPSDQFSSGGAQYSGQVDQNWDQLDQTDQSSGGGGGDLGGGGGAGDYGNYAAGGNVQGRPTTGGHVPRSASPSGGAETDDIPARLNADEFVIPQDVVHHLGTKHFSDLVKKSREARLGVAGPAPKPKMKPALRMKPTFTSSYMGGQ